MDFVYSRFKVLQQLSNQKWFSAQRTPLPIPDGDLTGKTVVVTGANRGIGFEAAKHFAKLGVGRLILGCRNAGVGNQAALEISDATGSNAVTCWPLDLSSFASVSAFVTRIQEEGVTIDILVGNAAIMDTHYTQTEDGWEKSLQVNYLSNVLLTVLLLPHLSRGSDIVNSGRIILLSSVVHYFITHLPEADSPDILSKLNDRQHCTKSVMALRYSISKLFILFFSRELAHRIDGNTGGPIVAAVDPGYCSTNLDHEAVSTAIRRFFIRIVNYFIARTPEMGSRTLIHAATRQESRALHGKYLTSCRVERESEYSLTGEGFTIQRRLWQETIDILQQVDPRVTTALADYF